MWEQGIYEKSIPSEFCSVPKIALKKKQSLFLKKASLEALP